MDKAEAGWVGSYDEQASARMAAEGIQALSSIGVLGDPREATVELGDAYLAAWTDIYAGIIRNDSAPPQINRVTNYETGGCYDSNCRVCRPWAVHGR